MGIVLAMTNAIRPYQNIYAQGDSVTSLITEKYKLFLYIPESEFVVNPFPSHIFNLVQPLDSLSNAKSILNIKYEVFIFIIFQIVNKFFKEFVIDFIF